MKNNIMSLIWRARTGALAMILILVLISPAFAQDSFKIWTTVASTGTVDDDDSNEIAFAGPFATFSIAAAPIARASIRYNVVAVDGLFTSSTPAASWPALIVRYRDNGPSARVTVFLREFNFNTGLSQTRITFDSDLYPQDDSYQTRAIGNCGNFNAFEFTDGPTVRAYYIEAALSRGDGSGEPGLASMALTKYGVCLAAP